MSSTQVNGSKGGKQGQRAASNLSKRQLTTLLASPKVSISVDGQVLFRIPRQVLAHYSSQWKSMLEQERVPMLYVPETHKATLTYVVQWMIEGGKDSTMNGAVPYPKDDLINLVCLNKLATYLDIDQLRDRTLNSIDLFTRHQPMTLECVDRLSKTSSLMPDARKIVMANLKKLVAGPANHTWEKKIAEHPDEYTAGQQLLSGLRKVVEEEKAGQRKLRFQDEKRLPDISKPTAATLATKGTMLTNAPVGKDKGPRDVGPNAPRQSNKLAQAEKSGLGSPTATTRLGTAKVTNGIAEQRFKAHKAKVGCFNCGQEDHTRPYCSNPRVFLGKCHICARQGHRAAECPDKTIYTKSQRQKVVPVANVNGTNPVFRPVKAEIISVHNKTPGPAKGSSTMGASPKSTSRKNSVKRDSVSSSSSGRQPSASTARTSPETTPQRPPKPAEQVVKPKEDVTPKVIRITTKKIRALNITADGKVMREMISGS